MARQASPTRERALQTTRDQSRRLALDDIGAWEGAHLLHLTPAGRLLGRPRPFLKQLTRVSGACGDPRRVRWQSLILLRSHVAANLAALVARAAYFL